MIEPNKPKAIYLTEVQNKVIKNLEGECKKHMTGFDKQLWVHGIRNILGNEIAELMKEAYFPYQFITVEDRCPL